jgi:hypothetical protein
MFFAGVVVGAFALAILQTVAAHVGVSPQISIS